MNLMLYNINGNILVEEEEQYELNINRSSCEVWIKCNIISIQIYTNMIPIECLVLNNINRNIQVLIEQYQ